MRSLPDGDPGSPDRGPRTPVGLLLWVANRQKRSMAAGILFDTVWLLGLALLPWAVGNALDDGILAGDGEALAHWVLVILGLAVVRAATEPLRDRAGVNNWMPAAYRCMQLVGHHVTRSGQAVTRRKSAGEIAAVGGDAMTLATSTTWSAPSPWRRCRRRWWRSSCSAPRWCSGCWC